MAWTHTTAPEVRQGSARKRDITRYRTELVNWRHGSVIVKLYPRLGEFQLVGRDSYRLLGSCFLRAGTKIGGRSGPKLLRQGLSNATVLFWAISFRHFSCISRVRKYSTNQKSAPTLGTHRCSAPARDTMAHQRRPGRPAARHGRRCAATRRREIVNGNHAGALRDRRVGQFPSVTPSRMRTQERHWRDKL